MIAELDAKYQYELKFNMFIDSLLNASGNTNEMIILLFQKKIASNTELDTIKTNKEANWNTVIRFCKRLKIE